MKVNIEKINETRVEIFMTPKELETLIMVLRFGKEDKGFHSDTQKICADLGQTLEKGR